ncbi:hypothetical protein [Streptomyces sp. AcE210]|uniref:hypothetical protein n=1 Tax=Streptomyces sp. AcE210 TaxID=2292703 RepID=UPI000E2FFE7E|nr:hypothetical protein [Streptomyces sp. AcE210]RFC76911.1 hypothetical protein DXZ75_02350 [Streptomyces sp. AcE210]
MNCPDDDMDIYPRSARRLALDRTLSIFAGTSFSPSQAVLSFADALSSPPGSDSTSSTIRR